MFGTILCFKPDRGFGFIRQSGQLADLFFHVSEFSGDEDLLRAGAKVEFNAGEYKGKKVARDIRLLEADIDTPEVRAILGSSGAA